MGLKVILTAWLLWGFFSEIGMGFSEKKSEYIVVGFLDLSAFIILMRGLA